MGNLDNIEVVPPEDLTFDLAKRCYTLLKEEPFFCELSRFMRKVPSKSIPTAGVRFCPETFSFELIFNPDFFSGLPKNQQVGVLKHEFMHVGLGHCTTRSVKDTNHMIQNIAMDLAINSLPNMPENLPDICCFPGKGEFKDLPGGQAFEFYLEQVSKIVKQKQKNGGKGKGQPGDGESQPGDGSEFGQFDSHEGWNGSGSGAEKPDAKDAAAQASKESAEKQIAEEKLRDIVQKAANAAMNDRTHGWGSCPIEARKLILEYLSRKPDPKSVLAYFIKTSIRADKIHRVTKINRRFPYVHPGRAWNRRAKIAISIDQSGSVSDKMLAKFYSWLNDFAKFADFTIIPFDDGVFEDKIFVWKKGQKKPPRRVLCGGTNFDAPTKWVNENKFDGHIICTDMCAPAPGRSNCARMWITDPACAERPYFDTREKVLVVD